MIVEFAKYTKFFDIPPCLLIELAIEMRILGELIIKQENNDETQVKVRNI